MIDRRLASRLSSCRSMIDRLPAIPGNARGDCRFTNDDRIVVTRLLDELEARLEAAEERVAIVQADLHSEENP